jgi:hypothetical protein
LKHLPVSVEVDRRSVHVYHESDKDLWDSLRLLDKFFPNLTSGLYEVSVTKEEALLMKRTIVCQLQREDIFKEERNRLNELILGLVESGSRSKVQKFLSDYAELRRSTDEKLAVQSLQRAESL